MDTGISSELAAPKIKVSKIDAARRQLDGALDLWFRDGDPVAIQTLISAAWQILQDLNEKKGNTESTMLGWAKIHVYPEHLEECMRLIRAPANFFKHADRDPYEVLEYNPKAAESEFVLAIHGHADLGEQPTDLQVAFINWLCVHKPHLIVQGKNHFEIHLTPDQLAAVRRVAKREFLEVILRLRFQAALKR
jgi:hypothetical protein